MRIKETILNTLFPKTCVNCGREGRYICGECDLFLGESYNEGNNISIWEYEGVIEKAIRKIKEEGIHNIIEELVERSFMVMANDTRFNSFLRFILLKNTYITFVPMHKEREKKIGFNQSELMAKKIASIVKKEVVFLLEKTKDTPLQESLRPAERIKNVEGAFKWKRKEVFENILLIDDFSGTRATINECIRILKESKAKNIYSFTFGHRIRL